MASEAGHTRTWRNFEWWTGVISLGREERFVVDGIRRSQVSWYRPGGGAALGHACVTGSEQGSAGTMQQLGTRVAVCVDSV